MASTCCWILNDKEVNNSVCFSGFYPKVDSKNQFIIIYLKKSPFTKKEIVRWLLHLKKMGFSFKYHFDKKKEAYLVDTTNIVKQCSRRYTMLFCTFIRFLWEGYIKCDYKGYDSDYFIEVIPIYFALYEYKKKYDKSLLLCMACSAWSMNNPSFNYNHFTCAPKGSLLRKDFKKVLDSINGFFRYDHEVLFNEIVGHIENRSNVKKEEIIKIFNFYNERKKLFIK